MEVIYQNIPNPSGRDGHKDLRNPVGMRRTTRNIDHRHTCFRDKTFAQKAPLFFFVPLHSGALGGVGRHGRNTAPGSAIADSDHITGYVGQFANPVLHGPFRKIIHRPVSIRALNDGPFIYKNIELYASTEDVVKQIGHLFPDFKREGRVVQNINAKISDQLYHRRLLRTQKRHGIPTTSAALKPEYVYH